MSSNILVIRDDEPRVSTWDLSLGFKVEHRALKRLIERYRSEFEELGIITTPLQKLILKAGRPTEDFELNEAQSTYLATLLTNNVNVRKFKLKLTKEFFSLRETLRNITFQKKDQDWIAKRNAGKIDRRIETDAIKEFINYAKSQGSQNADKYYMIISKMENQSLVHLELLKQNFDNIRDVVDMFTLSALQMADAMTAVIIRQGMKDCIFYKEIFQLAKSKVEAFALSIGKTPLRLAMKDLKKIEASA